MIYAGDQWIQYPVKDIYNTQMMAMAINAARDMYEKGQKQLDDFYTKYGDFTSPIQKDMDWYNQNVTGKARDVINNLYANGVDPLRSAEGRAAVSQLIYSMPTGDIAKLRQSAETAKEYIKNRGVLQATGKWDPEFEAFVNNGYSLEDWDTIGNGSVWTKSSPTEIKTLKELTEPWYNQRTAHMLDKAGVESFNMQYDPRYDYVGFTNKDLLDIAAGQTPGWNGSIYADYYRDVARKQLQSLGVKNPNDSQVEAMLQRNIAVANKEYLINPTRSVNQLYLQNLKNRQAVAIASMRNSNKNTKSKEQASTAFIDRLWNNVANNFDRKRFAPDSATKTINGIVEYWDKMAKSVEGKGKLIKTEDYVEYEPGLNRSKIVGAGPYARLAYEDNVAKKKTRNIYDQTNNALYKKYMHEKERWLKFVNGEYEPSIYDKSKEAAAVRQILKKGNKATTQEKAFVAQYGKNDMLQTMMRANSSSPAWSGKGNQPKGTMSTADAKKRASDFWDMFAAEGLGATQNKTLFYAFAGTDVAQKNPDLPNEQYSIRFGSGYHYAPVRQLSISGNAKFKHNDIHNKFDRFLQGQYGISSNVNDVRAAGIPHAGWAGNQLDILSHPAISKEQLEQFRSTLSNSKYKNMSLDDIAKQLGLRPVNQKTTYRGKDEQLHDTDTYYEVPVIRTIENLGGYNFRDINVSSDTNEFNAGIADKNVINSENQSVTDDLQQDQLFNYYNNIWKKDSE